MNTDIDAFDRDLTGRLWRKLGTDPSALQQLELHGPRALLPSVYDVDALASSAVALSLLSIAELAALRSGRALPAVRLDRRQAAALFRSERYVQTVGWQLPPLLDELMGDYRTGNGFIRLHTNYAHHRAALLEVLGVPAAREKLKEAVRAHDSEVLEDAVIAAGGCAAALRSTQEWQAHDQGRALAHEGVFELQTRPGRLELPELQAGQLPLSGVRVLDLTRVIAGPVATRLLAAYGAEVLRVDPPGFQEVGALLTETSVGKRRAFVDLKTSAGRGSFEELLRGAHVLVYGGRHGALEQLGFTRDVLLEQNPNLCIVRENAYGFTGPWANRRGFDSLVQMSTGIAQRSMQALQADRPRALPAQALDHATGYYVAAAVCTALTRALRDQLLSETRTSLARTAALLLELGDQRDPRGPELSQLDIEPFMEQAQTSFGEVRRVGAARGIEGITPSWPLPAGPLGTDPAAWAAS